MKKVLSIISLLLISILFTGCNKVVKKVPDYRNNLLKICETYYSDELKAQYKVDEQIKVIHKNGKYIVNFSSLEDADLLIQSKSYIDSGELTLDDVEWQSRENDYINLYTSLQQELVNKGGKGEVVLNVYTADNSILVCTVKNYFVTYNYYE